MERVAALARPDRLNEGKIGPSEAPSAMHFECRQEGRQLAQKGLAGAHERRTSDCWRCVVTRARCRSGGRADHWANALPVAGVSEVGTMQPSAVRSCP